MQASPLDITNIIIADKSSDVKGKNIMSNFAARPGTTKTSNATEVDTKALSISGSTGLEGEALISLGSNTDMALDLLNLSDSLLPRLSRLTRTIRSSRWHLILQSPDFGLSDKDAALLAASLLQDVRGIDSDVSKLKIGQKIAGQGKVIRKV